MFFLHELERTITLHPSFFGPRTKEYLSTRLLEDVEGTCNGQYYVIVVLDTFHISEGRIIPGSGYAEYTIQYRAVVCRPFKGETVSFKKRDIKLKTEDWSQLGRCDRQFRESYGRLCRRWPSPCLRL